MTESGKVSRYLYGNNRWDFVLTRLHARYGKDIKNDLEFKMAEPIVGGLIALAVPARRKVRR